MRYCDTCQAVRAIAQCPRCGEPTKTWAERLSEADRIFLASIKITSTDDDTPSPVA